MPVKLGPENDFLRKVKVRLLGDDEVGQFNFHLEREHYLESSRFAGQTLRYDYLFGLKGNQSGILDKAKRLLAQQGFPPSGHLGKDDLTIGALAVWPSAPKKLDCAVAGKSSR